MIKYLTFGVAVICAYYVLDVSAVSVDLVSQECLGCICHASSGCTAQTCVGDVCGPFKMTWAYWADAGKPTINKQLPDEASAFANCANDHYCAAKAVQVYMNKYKQDCNQDGVIDCYDFAALHKLGGYGCKAVIPDDFLQPFSQCMHMMKG